MTPYSHLEHRSLVALAALAKVQELLAGGDAVGARLALWHVQDAVDAAYWAGSSDGIDRMMDSLSGSRARAREAASIAHKTIPLEGPSGDQGSSAPEGQG